MGATHLPLDATLEQYEGQAKQFLQAYDAGHPEAVRRVEGHGTGNRGKGRRDLTVAEAQDVVAREYGFAGWPHLAAHVAALGEKGSAVVRFEAAVEAVIDGDLTTLEGLLRADPGLARARSDRPHHATLLHYVSANGVEGYRQRTPKNAVAVAKMLLAAGAEVDTQAELYGKDDTTLGLVASSVHPARSGVQGALIETLLDAGAAIEGPPGGCTPLMAAVFNGCPAAIDTLVRRGAKVDNLLAAAALGRVDLVEKLANGNQAASADRRAEMEQAFNLACSFGRTEVAERLLERGVDAAAKDKEGFTGLHHAAYFGHLDTVKRLAHRSPLESRNAYGGTVLDCAVWASANSGLSVDYVPIVEALIDAGARIEAVGYPSGNERVDAVLRAHGARAGDR